MTDKREPTKKEEVKVKIIPKFTKEELMIIWVTLNREFQNGQIKTRMYSDLSKEKNAMSIIEKMDIFKENVGEDMISYKDCELDFSTEEKSLLLGYIRTFPLSLQETKLRQPLIDKLN